MCRRATISLIAQLQYCPLLCFGDIKSEPVVLAFQDNGEMAKRNPTILHAFFAQNVLLKAADFSETLVSING